MAETKRRFRETYPKPVSGIYDAVIQELLVQQHLIRYNKRYQYNPVRTWRRPLLRIVQDSACQSEHHSVR